MKLFERIAKDFDPYQIDQRLYYSNHLTLIGIWLIDPQSKVFDQMGRVICKIKEMIKAEPDINQVSAKELAQKLDLEEPDVGRALLLMSDLGDFTSGGSSSNGYFDSINFPSNYKGYDAYLRYENLDDLMEEFYTRKPKAPFSRDSLTTSFAPRNSLLYPASVDAPKQKPMTAFVIMPIDSSKPDLQDVLKSIKTVCAKFDISAVRADEIEHQQQITDVVLQQIKECEFLIADLSLERPNVYYEIGYAHAMGKRPILFRKKGTQLHFDLSIHNAREFENMTELEKKLESYFEEVMGRKAK